VTGSIERIAWVFGSASLYLDSGRISGSGGINRLMGEYQLGESSLKFGPVATTMMAGPPDQMEAEQRFLASLARITRWSVEDGNLVLSDEAGRTLIVLQEAADRPRS
jgi:heat shock protein HslJ